MRPNRSGFLERHVDIGASVAQSVFGQQACSTSTITHFVSTAFVGLPSEVSEGSGRGALGSNAVMLGRLDPSLV